MSVNKTLPKVIVLLVFMILPVLVAAGGQNETPDQQKERQRKEQQRQQQQQQQQPIRQQQDLQRQQQQRQQQETQRQQQLGQQQEQQRQQQLRQQQEQQRLEQTRQHPEQPRQIQPGHERVQNPGQERIQNPGQERTQNPGQGRVQNPGQERVQNPGQGRVQNPGQERQQFPGQQQRLGQPVGQNHGTPRVLSPDESQQRIQQLNQNRTRMGGINHRPLPTGQMTALPDGRQVIATKRGSQLEVRPNGALEKVRLSDGRSATFHPNGKIGSVRAPGIRINNGLRGERIVVTEHNGRRLVSDGPHHGYLERPYMNRGGRAYVQRTYWSGNHYYVHVYRDQYYGGHHYYRYVPVYYYHPMFYGWAYDPWPSPVRYRWGWYEEPWHTYYGGYFAPEPVYPSALMWLTDFLLIENLRAAYQARQDAEAQGYQQEEVPPPDGESPASGQLSPEIKAAIQAEVQRQLADEQAEAAQPPSPNGPPPEVGDDHPPAALDPARRLFVVSSNLSVSTTDGQECELTPGDVITRLDDTPGDDGNVRVSVLTSKQQDCRVGAMPLVGVNDLQEMQNSFREKVDSGLQKLATNQGGNGLPPAPDPTTVAGDVPPPAPDGNIDASLQEQQKEAAAAESQVEQQIQADEDQSY
jgi:hypothetical protein